MQKYSIFSLMKNAFSNHEKWDLAWKDPSPKKEYDVVIIGGGGHGLATAYYLAKEHNITNVAIIEKGWIGGGNVGRNTTIIRSNYMHDDNALFSEFGMDLWRRMSQDLNYNVMFSPRGIINLAHSDAQMNTYARRGNSMRLNGIDAVLLNREEVREIIPNSFLLVPGIGAQGGSLSDVCRFGLNENCGLIVNSSRQIIYSDNSIDYAKKSAEISSLIQRVMSEQLLKKGII